MQQVWRADHMNKACCNRQWLRGILILLSFTLLSSAGISAQPWQTGGPLSEHQAAFDIRYYDISLRLAPDYQAISGHVTVHGDALTDGLQTIELDLISNYRVGHAESGGRQAGFRHEGNKLLIDLPEPANTGDRVAVRVVWSGKPPVAVRPPWDGGFNWSRDSEGNHWIGVSCQGEGAQIWFPNVVHPARRPDSASVRVTVPSPYVVASNGLLQSVDDPGNGFLTWNWKTRYPIHTYNINFSIGRYEVVEKPFRLEDGTEMPVVFYVLPGDAGNADGLIGMAKDMLRRLGRYYGEYPFRSEKFGIVQTDYLGMEHQTINAYGNNFNYTRINGEEYDWLLPHEMGHEWWGNKITVTDWADFWIHEGITTYTDALYLWDRFGPDAYHAKFNDYRRRITNRQPVIPGTDVTSKEVYNLDVYYKGAYFMHSLRHLMGDSLFFGTVRAFATDAARTYAHPTSTTDFRTFFEKRSGLDLEPFFDLYLYRTELPDVRILEDGDNSWLISIPNITFRLPVDVATVGDVLRLNLGPEPVQVASTVKPVVDPLNWYLWNSRP
jgi:aminopeptidase N